jgi:glycosyltransferase involved in cell wall biosynthesis
MPHFLPPHPSQSDSHKPYRFGFILSTVMGNKTRYLNFRKYAERDPEVELVWAPVTHYMDPAHPTPFSWLPHSLRQRAFVLQQAQAVLGRMNRLDAVMIHLFEAYVYSCVRSLVAQRQPLIINSPDDPPMVDPASYPRYEWHLRKQLWRQQLRLQLDCWCAQRTSLFVPWSNWAADIYTQGCGVAPAQVHPIHVGIDLEQWQRVSKPPNPKPKILFVGGDFHRKGGDLLLEVFQTRFRDRAELHLVTKTAPEQLPANVFVHADLGPNDPRLTQLYAEADIFALPTRADLSSFASLEAMASSCPVIATRVGGVTDVVRHGETGLLITKDDGQALADALQVLVEDPARRLAMGQQGRQWVEESFSAAVTVPRILDVMKTAVDHQRGSQTTQGLKAPLETLLS